jgi:hypothetical protein
MQWQNKIKLHKQEKKIENLDLAKTYISNSLKIKMEAQGTKNEKSSATD